MKRLLDPRQFRRNTEIDIDLGDDLFVRARKTDMTALVLDGKLPMPILMAVQKMIELPGSSPMERVAALGDNGGSLLELLRMHAVEVVMEPPLSLGDTTNPDILPVQYPTLSQLMAIWTQTAIVPVVTHKVAATFRGERSPDDAAPVPHVEDVPPVPEHVDRPDVEFVGQ